MVLVFVRCKEEQLDQLGDEACLNDLLADSLIYLVIQVVIKERLQDQKNVHLFICILS